MRNLQVQTYLDICTTDMDKIEKIIDGLGQLSNIVPFLTKYAIIKACGTLELSFKTLLADQLNANAGHQLVTYVNKTIREKPLNPNMSNWHQLLKKLDKSWSDQFKVNVDALPHSAKIYTSLDSLNAARNAFAHGLEPNVSFPSVKEYFADSRRALEILDLIF